MHDPRPTPGPRAGTQDWKGVMHELHDSTRPPTPTGAPVSTDGSGTRTPPGGGLHHGFEQQARRAPGRTALSHGTEQLTYGELDRAADRLAGLLRRQGAGPGRFVGVCADRSAELVIALLAVLKSGAAYVPLDPAYPVERTRFTLEDTGCRLVVGQERHRERSTEAGAAFLAVDNSTLLAGAPVLQATTTGPVGDVQPAYVIHTSGSTGTPKGVVVSHQNALRLFDACRDEFGIAAAGSDDTWTLFHSTAFDFSVWEIWGALLHGGRVVVVDHVTSRSPDSFLRLLIDQRVTVLSQTPTAFRQLLRAAEADGWPETDLRLVVLGGETLEPATLRPWFDRYGDLSPRVVNMYGITETTVHVTHRDMTAFDCDAAHSPIGKPLRDLKVHLLDNAMRPVPAGDVGEMYVGGAGVTQGYLNRPDLTEQRFVPDPFGAPGDRLYRTGDLAVRRPDGELEFRGRRDDQVQLRGFRIELGEIEVALAALPGVREAAVALGEDALGEPRLVGYAVLAPGHSTPEEALREALSDRLPGHMVPSAVVLLDAFPLTANGKLDRKSLPAPAPPADHTALSGSAAGDPGAAPGMREILHQVWARALGRRTVDPHANFFALGGDSITAVRVVGAAREAGLRLRVEDVFTHPTLASLQTRCAVSDGPRHPREARALDMLTPRDRDRLPTGIVDAYPLTLLQLGMVFESQVSPDATLYHDLVSARIEGSYDEVALRRALASVTVRHDVLRTSFDLGTYSEPLQLVHEDVDAVLHLHGPATAGTPSGTVEEWWREEWRRPFDFSAAPLWRCHVHDHADGSFQLSVSAHHSILDGWSFSLLLTELITGYERELVGGSTPLPASGPPYRAAVELERAARESSASQRYWSEACRKNAGHLPLPAPPGAAPTTPSLEPDVRLPLPVALTDAARAGADRLGVPTKSVFLAVHLWALSEAAGADPAPLTTGLVANTRPETADSERTLGLFLNSVPLAATVRDATWQDLVRDVFAREQALLPHRRFPMADIRNATGEAPFSVLFNYTDFRSFDDLDALRRLRVADWWSCDRTSFPVVVEVARRPMGTDWELTIRADATQTDPAFCARVAPLFLEGLRRFREEWADAR